MLVIVAGEVDAHADAVVIALRSLNFHQFVRIDFETAYSNFDVRLSPEHGDCAITSRKVTGRSCSIEDVKTVWWRREISVRSPMELELPSDKTLDAVECYWAFRWQIEALPSDRFPLSHPYRIREASNKISQLHLAKNIGLKVPDTLFSNDKAALLDFVSRHPEIIIKPLKTTVASSGPSNREITLITRPTTSEKIKELIVQTDIPAVYCQERIRKVADVRVNILPSRSLACRIDTSNLPSHEVDWRPTTFDHEHKIIPFPQELDALCRELLRHFGLRWGAFDFALDDAGDWTFFECNPNGAWLWIEIKTGVPISKYVANTLIEHHEASESACSK